MKKERREAHSFAMRCRTLIKIAYLDCPTFFTSTTNFNARCAKRPAVVFGGRAKIDKEIFNETMRNSIDAAIENLLSFIDDHDVPSIRIVHPSTVVAVTTQPRNFNQFYHQLILELPQVHYYR